MEQQNKLAEHLAKALQAMGVDPNEIESAQYYEVDEPPAMPHEKAVHAYELIRDYFVYNERLMRAARAFEELLPQKEPVPPYSMGHFKNDFFGSPGEERIYRLQETLSPVGVALITLQEFFSQERFSVHDPRQLPGVEKLNVSPRVDEPVWIPVNLGPNKFTVPDQREIWVSDNRFHRNYVIQYGVAAGGALKIQIEASWEFSDIAGDLLKEIKDTVMLSKYFRGQVLELTPRGFTILELPEQRMPIIDKQLKSELDKNVLNIFKKAEDFKQYGLPSKRAIILEGQPGNGKTMIERYLAYTLKGTVTVLWVTAKSIDDPGDIAQIFEMARKLSPVLIILEDLDLMAGTRLHDEECLGEMLNQLDGINANEELVLVASTNCVKALDTALSDRPGRFDRIYQIGKPNGELAEQIARQYLSERKLTPELIDKLSYGCLSKGDLSGAQIVEVMKGGLFEAIHRGCELNDLCLTASYQGLMNQRKIFGGDQS